MALEGIALADITADHILNLVNGKIEERQTLDYKRKLPGGSDEDKREFLYDVASFANARGGHILYGVDESEGVPIDTPGLENVDIDQEKLRLEQSIRDGIAPRVPGIDLKPVKVKDAPVLILRIPKSWQAPHVVTFKNYSRFYTRGSGGKYQMDVPQLRAAFIASETAFERFKNFRLQRISDIIAQNTPIPLAGTATVALHSVPLCAFSEEAPQLALSDERWESLSQLRTIYGQPNRYWHNFDGIVAKTDLQTTQSYVQVFRNGCLEAVDTRVLDQWQEDSRGRFLPYVDAEQSLMESAGAMLQFQKAHAVDSPVLLAVSLLRVSRYQIEYRTSRAFPRSDMGQPIDRDALLCSEVLVEDYDSDIAQLMRPIFDQVWNAAGHARCRSYDSEGKWRAT